LSIYPQHLLDTHEEIIIDGFSGGGGTSIGIELGLGRSADVAINHDDDATQMHKANHPNTQHHTCDIFEVDPRIASGGRPVAFLWISPDCTDHSKAKGDKPLRSPSIKRRALAHVGLWWTGTVKPRGLILENVEEFKDWTRLVAKREWITEVHVRADGIEWESRRKAIKKVDGTYAARGEYVPMHMQLLTRDRNPKRKGEKFRKFVRALEDRGYVVEHREMRACVHGIVAGKVVVEAAPTIRKRLILIARRDGAAIVWPAVTHGDPRSLEVKSGKLRPWRTAAGCIDWRNPMLSIFATKSEAKAWADKLGQASPLRPLAEKTMHRIARGVKRYVLDNPRPFLVTLNHGGEWQRGWPLDEPLRTLTAARDAHGLVAPVVSSGQQGGSSRDAVQPLQTVTASEKDTNQIIGVGMVPRYGEREGQEPRVRSIEEPAATVVNTDNGGRLVAAHATKFRNGATGFELTEPMHTVTANSNEANHLGGATPLGVVAANLSTYYGAKSDDDARGSELDEPIATQPTENRHALVASFLAQQNGGFYDDQGGSGRSLDDPNPAVCAKGSLQSLVGASMVKLKGTATDADPAEPLDTINAGGLHHGIAAAHLVTNNNSGQPSYAVDGPAHTVVADGAAHNLVATHIQRDFGQSVGSATDEPIGTVTPNGQGKAAMVASFLQKYYGTGGDQDPASPLHTIPTVDRFGLVTVEIEGQTYVIQDIAMRMLQPRELYNAQGFPASYIIDRGADGRKFTKTAQVRMCGNSVCPPLAAAIVRANFPEMIARKELRAS
jgi:DNA (cytosine-5)-methyltransferase 1